MLYVRMLWAQGYGQPSAPAAFQPLFSYSLGPVGPAWGGGPFPRSFQHVYQHMHLWLKCRANCLCLSSLTNLAHPPLASECAWCVGPRSCLCVHCYRSQAARVSYARGASSHAVAWAKVISARFVSMLPAGPLTSRGTWGRIVACLRRPGHV